jgi:hypothetical protein
MNEAAERFFKNRCISTEISLNPYVLNAAEIIELVNDEVNRLAEQHIERLQHEAAWSILHDMYKKCHEFTGGALATFLIAHIGAAEALCRTAVESAVNLHYASCGDDIGNVLAYFRNYIITERGQNKAWLKSVENSNYANEAKNHHRALIEDKERSLNFYEDALRKSLSIINIDYDNHPGSWPSTFDRFSKIDKEVDYRTVYAALCSQAHNDPEDILNNLMSRVVVFEGYEESVEIEKYVFSLNMVLTSICFYVEASGMYLAKYNVSVTETLIPLLKRATDLLVELQSQSKGHILRPLKLAPNSALRGR